MIYLPKEIQVLLYSQIIIEYIVLRAESKTRPDPLQIAPDATSIQEGCAASGWDESSQHGHRGGLTCAVVTQQDSDLTLVHVHGDIVDCGFVLEHLR